MSWSLKFTGATKAVLARVLAHTEPNDERNCKSFCLARHLIVETLKEAANISAAGQVPAPSVELSASGFFAHDGRSEVTIKVQPIALELEAPAPTVEEMRAAIDHFRVTAPGTPTAAESPVTDQVVPSGAESPVTDQAAPVADQSPAGCPDCGAVEGHTRGCPKF